MNELIDNPIFITGHTRSGTNLLMRLLDSSSDLLSPPGEGKLHVLRRLAFSNKLSSNNDTQANTLADMIELQLDITRENQFRAHLNSICTNTGYQSVRGAVRCLLSALIEFSNLQDDARPVRWLEKNHNIEFYWGRAQLLFANPCLIVMVRDPRDVWTSWGEYCRRHKLDTGKNQMRRNLQQHLFEEIIEANLGVSRFQNIVEIADYYSIPDERMPFLFKGLTQVLMQGWNCDAVASEIIDINSLAHNKHAAGRFAWNYRIMLQRSIWLARKWPEQVALIEYEKLVTSPSKKINQLSKFCSIRLPAISDRPTELGRAWHGNSNFSDKIEDISTDSIGRWKQQLEKREVLALTDVAVPVYKEAQRISI